ncbi:MAG: protein kinase [Myxococcota bacterium]
MEGKTFNGRYRLDEHLGSGAMGAVYRARHLELDTEVAVKVLHAELRHTQTELVERFRAEARVAMKIDHPNAVRVFDFGQSENGDLYLVMELLTGRDLQAAMLEGPLPRERVLSIARDVAASLQAAHDAGVVHRDLKPSNIMLTERPEGERVKVCDFGLARIVSGDGSMTQSGAVFGTPSYMSPEQARGVPADARADVYSLGVIMFRLLEGRPLFQAETTVGMLMNHIMEPPPSLTGQSLALTDLVASCLKKAPDDRPPSMSVVIQALDAIRDPQGSSVPSQAAGPPDHDKDSVQRAAPRRWSLAVAGLSALGVLLGLGWLWPLGPSTEPVTRSAYKREASIAARDPSAPFDAGGALPSSRPIHEDPEPVQTPGRAAQSVAVGPDQPSRPVRSTRRARSPRIEAAPNAEDRSQVQHRNTPDLSVDAQALEADPEPPSQLEDQTLEDPRPAPLEEASSKDPAPVFDPKLSIESLTVSGGMGLTRYQRALERGLKRLEACLRPRALERGRAGEVRVRLRLGFNGRVQSLDVDDSQLPGGRSCAVRHVRGSRLPLPDTGAVVVEYVLRIQGA